MNRTKRLIFESAIRIFSDCGYRGATMDDIASSAGLAKGTLYYHFTSKEEIFNFIVKEGVQILKSQAMEIQSMEIGPIDKLSNISGGSSYGGLLEYIKELRKSRSGGSDLISHIESLRKEYNSSQNSNPLTPIGIQ